MKPARSSAWQASLIWALSGGAWGAWVGFRGIYRILPHMNGDTAAPVFVWGMFGVFALIGLVVGAALALAVGLGCNGLLQRLRADKAPAMVVASLAVVLALSLAAGLVARSYPGLRGPEAEPRRTAPVVAGGTAGQRPLANPCAGAPPTDARERASWDLECK